MAETTQPAAVPVDDEPVRIYLVEGELADGPKIRRLILAKTAHQAIGYCVRTEFKATVPKPRHLKNLLDEKLLVEDATTKSKGRS